MSTDSRGLGGSLRPDLSLTGLWPGRSGRNLPNPIQAISAAECHALESRMGPAQFRELESLSHEQDPEIYAEGMLQLAGRLEAQDRLDAAAQLYASMAGSDSRAQARLDAITGGGAIGPRAEFLLRRLSRDLTRPEPLLAMGAASLAFRVVRLGALSHILSGPTVGLINSANRARWVAGSAAFLAEGTVFALAQKGLTEALGNHSDWGPNGVLRDIASSLLVLGGLRLGGMGSQALFRGLHGAAAGLRYPTLAPLTRQLLTQGGMFGGILLGHRLEQFSGLRENSGSTLIDSLVTLLHFNLLGGLSRRLLPRVHDLEFNLDRRAEGLARTGPLRPWMNPFGLRPVPAGGGETMGRPEIFMMVGGNEGGGPPGGRKLSPHATLPFPLRAADIPLVFQSIHTVTRQLTEGRLRFPERLAQADVLVKIVEDVSESTRSGFPGVFRQFLETTAARHPIPEGRRVELQIASHPSLHFQRIGVSFQLVDPAETLPSPPPSDGVPEAPILDVTRSSDNHKTLPFGVEASGRDPRVSLLSVEILRRIRDPHYRFAEYLRDNDVEFTLERDDTLDREGFVRILVRVLNELPDVYIHRVVTLRLEPSGDRIVLVNSENGFEELQGERARMGTADTILALLPETPDNDPSPPAPVSSREPAPVRVLLGQSSGVPLLIRDLSQLADTLNWALLHRLEGEHPVPIILEKLARAEGIPPPTVTAELLHQVAPRMSREAPEPMAFEFHVPATGEVFMGEINGSELRWRKGSNYFVQQAAIQIFSPTINAQFPTSIYHILDAFSRDEQRAADQDITLHFPGPPPTPSLMSFREYIRQSLTALALPARSLRMEFATGEAPLLFEGNNGFWSAPSPITPVPAPVALPPVGEMRVAGSQLELRPLLNEFLSPEFPGSSLDVFLERRNILTSAEVRRMEGSLAELAEGRLLRIHDLKGRKTIIFELSGSGLRTSSEAWERPTDFQEFRAGSMTELIQRLAFLRGLVMPRSELRSRIEAAVSEPQLSILLGALNRWMWFPVNEFELVVSSGAGEGSSPPSQRWRIRKEIQSWVALPLPETNRP